MSNEAIKPASQLVRRAKYPGMSDGYPVYRNLAAPLIYANLGFMAFYTAETIALLTGVLTPETRELVKNFVDPVSRVVGYGSVALIFPSVYSTFKEHHNRILFGESLTVSRVAVLPGDSSVKTFPELKSEKDYGEMHFTGNKYDFQVTQAPDFHKVMREGINGLQLLIGAIENEDPKIKDINYFVGRSKMLFPRIDRLGFKVVDTPDENYRIKDPADYLEKALGPRPLHWLQHRKSMMCIASRDDLVSKKDAINRFAEKISA